MDSFPLFQTLPWHLFQTLPWHLFQTLPWHLFQTLPWHDAVATLILALLWLRIMDAIAHQDWLEPKLSRKIIHIGTGPLFVL